MTTEAPAPLLARARAAAARATGAASSLLRDARPWLRREQWTRENVEPLAAAARRRPRRALALLGGGVLLLAGLAWLLGGDGGGLPAAEVREGPFRVSIAEAATLQALRSVTYSSTIQSNQAKIVALAPGRPRPTS